MFIPLSFPVTICLMVGIPMSFSSSAKQTAGDSQAKVAAETDVDSIDHVVHALYEVISGPASEKRDWNRMRTLFMPGATMGAIVETKDGKIRQAEFSVEKYILGSAPQMEKSGFFENEIGRKTEEFGHIAHVFSTYESRFDPSQKPFERGINSLQLSFDGHRWWIRTILWEGETPKTKLPLKYIGKN